MAERLNAPVLKTGEGNTSGGSNPPLPATTSKTPKIQTLLFVIYCYLVAKLTISTLIDLNAAVKMSSSHLSPNKWLIFDLA